jgi:outer membrane protein assembly factor BamB
VYAGSDNSYLYAVDATTGQERWRRPLNSGPFVSTPTVHGDLVYAITQKTLHAIDVRTGLGHWAFGVRAQMSSTVGVIGDQVCVTDGGTLTMLDAEHGTKYWGCSIGLSHHRWVVMDGPVALVGGWGNHVYAVETYMRRKKWGTRVSGRPVSGPAALSDGHLYVGNQRGELHALDTSNGHRTWLYHTGSAIDYAPTLADGTVYVGNYDARLHALDSNTGELKWQFTATAPIRSTPAVAGTTVYVCSEDGSVYAVDTATGQERWRFPTGGCTVSSPAVADGVVYVGSDDGKVYAIEAAD